MNSNPFENFRNRIIHIRSEASWVLIGQLGVAASTLIGVKLVTHFITPTEYGRWSLANTIVILIGMNLFGPLGQGLMRFWAISLKKQELNLFLEASKRYIKYLLIVVVVFTITISLLIFLTSIKGWVLLFAGSMAVGGLTGWSRIYLLVLTAARKRAVVAFLNTGTAFAKPLFAVIFVVLFMATAEWVMFGFLLAIGISLYWVNHFYKKMLMSAVQVSGAAPYDALKMKKLGKEIVTFSTPFYIWGSFAWIHQSCDRWALLTYHGSDVVGAFAVLTQLALYPLIFGSTFLSSFFLPIAYERAGNLESQASIRSANKILFLTTALYLCGSIFLISLMSAFHRPLVLLISNKQYAGLSHLLPGLTIAWALYYLGQTLSGFGMIVNKTRIYMPVIVTTGIIALLSTFYFSSKTGPSGVVWGLGIAGLVYACWMMTISFRLINSAQARSQAT